MGHADLLIAELTIATVSMNAEQFSAGETASLAVLNSVSPSLNPGNSSPDTNVAPDFSEDDSQASSDSDKAIRQFKQLRKAQLKEGPKMWIPHLEKFTLFPKLPIEIRQAVWKCTLQPRIVELSHSCERGYYSRVETPVSLRVNKDSRKAVGFLYPLCFGSILHQARIVFNFSMDTLYFDEMIWNEVPNFLVGLKDFELQQLQYIAFDRLIDEAREWDDMYYNPYLNMDCLQKAATAMPALKEIYIVVKIDEMWHEHHYPESNGMIKLSEEFPSELKKYCWDPEDSDDGHLDMECECMLKPKYTDELKDFDVPKKDSIWGWRLMKTKK
jgi:hypothetical protein